MPGEVPNVSAFGFLLILLWSARSGTRPEEHGSWWDLNGPHCGMLMRAFCTFSLTEYPRAALFSVMGGRGEDGGEDLKSY